MDFVQQQEDGPDQDHSFTSRKKSRLQNLEETELLKSEASKITMTYSRKNVKNVSVRKKRQPEISPPQASENGNKVPFY